MLQSVQTLFQNHLGTDACLAPSKVTQAPWTLKLGSNHGWPERTVAKTVSLNLTCIEEEEGHSQSEKSHQGDQE